MKPDAFLAKFAPVYRPYAAGYNLPLPMLLAQVAIESGWGEKSAPGTTLNFTGMKRTPSMWQSAGKPVMATENQHKAKADLEPAVFCQYWTADECASHHCRTLAFSGNYVRFRRLFAESRPMSEVVGAMATVYCTDASYAGKLLKIIAQLEGIAGPDLNLIA